MTVVRAREGRVVWAKRNGVLQRVWPLESAPAGQISAARKGTLVNAGTGTSTLAVPYAPSVAAGDFLMIAMPSRADVTGADFTASGWTSLRAQSGTFTRYTTLMRIATSADVGQATVTVSGQPVFRTARMLAFSGVDAANPVAGVSRYEEPGTATVTTAVMPSLTPPVAGCMPVWAGSGFLGPSLTNTFTSPDSGAVEVLDTWQDTAIDNNNGRAGFVYHQSAPLTTTAATGTRSATTGTSSTLTGLYLLLRPAA